MVDLLTSFSVGFKELLRSTTEQNEIFTGGRRLLAELAAKPVFLQEILTKLATDDEFLLNRRIPTDPNEVTLFKDKEGLFSLRLYIWDPAINYPAHSHGSWGIICCLAGAVEERKYERLDDKSMPGYARLRETGRFVLKPVETSTVLPGDLGIHKMDSLVKEHSTISLHVYGKAEREGYLEMFNLHKDSVYRVTFPAMNVRIYALKALGAIKEDWAGDVLKKAGADRRPLIRFEALRALAITEKDAAVSLIEQEIRQQKGMEKEFSTLMNSLK
jgi:predicted metal-dependent enzyme (double-stranded beta helix superfamily)